MKLIGHLNASVILRETIEEYAPESGVIVPDMIELVRSAYSFQMYPQINQGEPALIPSTLQFHLGKFTAPDEKAFAIASILMEPSGDMIQTMTTDQADRVMDDLLNRLDTDLGFRLKQSEKKRAYLSNLVVEFDGPIENGFVKVKRIADAINGALQIKGSLNFKRLAFGAEVPQIAQDPIAFALASTDFVIERRIGAAFDQNRYFCAAPMRTADHLAVLTEIEKVLLEP